MQNCVDKNAIMHIIAVMNKLQKHIQDLKNADLSEKAIVKALEDRGCKCSQSTINRILNGEIKNPRWTIGNALTELHGEYFSSQFIQDLSRQKAS